MSLTITKTVPELRAAVAALKKRGKVALVPTLGALHAGHMALVAEAKRHAQSVIVYIFLNPKQFAAHEDLGSYPKTWDTDVEKCRAAGVDMIYAPTADDVYPPGFSTHVSVKGVSAPLEGEMRPHFFDGVATVLAKMFIRVGADVAMFGEKDYQQLLVVKQLVRDLDIPVEIIGVPTVREPSGLALSSRNAYLDEQQRATAATLYAALGEAAEKLRAGISAQLCLKEAQQKLLDAGFAKVDYVALRDAETLDSPQGSRPARLLAAAWLGTTRLIDNVSVTGGA